MLPLLDEQPVTLGVTLGQKCDHPITLSMPVLISHMSIGVLSKETKMALALASRDAGIAICSGEGGPQAGGNQDRPSRVEENLEAAMNSDPDWITIDGRPGATGAAPVQLKDHVGIPTLYAVEHTRRFFDRYRMRDVELIVTGGLRKLADFVKAIALGANAMAIATSAMIAIGCQQYRACHTGNCPVGIATQRNELRERFEIDSARAMAGNYFEVVREQLEEYCRVLGKQDIQQLSVEDLVTTDGEVSGHTAIEHA